jgi:CRP-like cAMP-binding protein
VSGTSRISGALSQCSLFYGRPIHALVTSSALHRYAAGDPVFVAGAPAPFLLVMVTGRVRAHTARLSGAERDLGEHRAPDAVVEVGLFASDRLHRLSLTALTDVEAVHVPREALLRAAAKDVALTERLLTAVAEAAGAPGPATAVDLGERLLRCLRDLAAQFGVPQPDGSVLIGLRVSHGELAALVGAAGREVGSAIRALVDAEQLERLGDYYLLPG